MKRVLSELERREVARAIGDGRWPSKAQHARRWRLMEAGVLNILWPGRWYVTQPGLKLMGERFADIVGTGLQNDSSWNL